MSRLKRLVIALIIVGLTTANVMVLAKLGELKNELRNLRNDLSFIRSDVGSVQSRMNSFINELSQAQKVVSRQYYDITNVGNKYQTAHVDVDLRFSRLPNDANVYLIYQNYELDDAPWQEVDLTHTAGLNYGAELELSYDGSYNLVAVIENDAEVINEQLRSIDLHQQLSGRIKMDATPRTADSKGNLTYEVSVCNYHDQQEFLKLTAVRCNVYYKDALMEEVNIFTEGDHNDTFPRDMEHWHYEGQLRVEGVDDPGFMENVIIEVIAADGLGKTYTYSSASAHECHY